MSKHNFANYIINVAAFSTAEHFLGQKTLILISSLTDREFEDDMLPSHSMVCLDNGMFGFIMNFN